MEKGKSDWIHFNNFWHQNAFIPYTFTSFLRRVHRYVLTQLAVQLLWVYSKSQATALRNTYESHCTSDCGSKKSPAGQKTCERHGPFFTASTLIPVQELHFHNANDQIMKPSTCVSDQGCFWSIVFAMKITKPKKSHFPLGRYQTKVDNGTVPVCFDAASKGGFHSKWLTYPKHYTTAS